MRQTASISEIGRLTGLDRVTIGKYLGHIEPAILNGPQGSKQYYLDQVLTALVRSFKIRSEDSAKARKEAADAEKAEINVARLRGDLVPVAEVRSSAAELVKSLFQRCVMLAPRLLSDQVTGSEDRGEVEIRIREHFSAIFDELRSLPNDFLHMKAEDAESSAADGPPKDI